MKELNIKLIVFASLVIVVLIIQLLLFDLVKTIEDDKSYIVMNSPRFTPVPTSVPTAEPTREPTPTILMTEVPEETNYTPAKIEDLSIGGIRLMMNEQEALEILGEPHYKNVYFSELGYDGWRTALYYNFGRITLFSEDIERTNSFVVEIFIYKDSYSSPLNITVGDSLSDVISTLNINWGIIENRQKKLYDESGEYGHVCYYKDSVKHIALEVYDSNSDEYVNLIYSFIDNVLTEISLYSDSY